MPITVTCPECDDTYQISDADAEKLVRCRRCQCPIETKRLAEGIQAKPAVPVSATTSRPRADDEDDRPPRRHPIPRSPFPLTALLVIVIGLLFLLLAFSIGFNVWFITKADDAFGRNAAMRAEQDAMQQRKRAEEMAEMARQQQDLAQKNAAVARRQAEELRQELQRAKDELDDAKRQKLKMP